MIFITESYTTMYIKQLSFEWESHIASNAMRGGSNGWNELHRPKMLLMSMNAHQCYW